MLMHYQRQIVGYHGCLVERHEAALLHGTHPGASADPNDWLGQGIYFWEHGPKRALQWARAHAKRRERPESDARVLGAVIQLGTCFDLLDTQATDALAEAHRILEQTLRSEGQPVPLNRTPDSQHEAIANGDVLLRPLDCVSVERAYAKIAPMFWGKRIPLDEACATIRAWVGALRG